VRELRRLLRLARPHWPEVLLAAVLGFATVGAGVGLMAASAFIIASAALHPSIAELQVAIVGVRFFGISRGVFRYLERLVSHDLTFRILASIRTWFFVAVEPLAPARLSILRSGDLLARTLSDVAALENLYVRALAPPLVAVAVTAATTLFLGWHGELLAPAYLAAALTAGVALPLLLRRVSRGLGDGERRTVARLHVTAVDLVQGLPDLLALGREEEILRRLETLGEELVSIQERSGRTGGLETALSGLAATLGTAAVLALAIPMVREGRFGGVTLAVLALAALASFEAFQPLPAAARSLEEQAAAARRLFEITDTPPAVEDPPDPLPLPDPPVPRAPDIPMLAARRLRFRYPSDGPTPPGPPALDRLDLELSPGRHVALVGPSGSGKSTLLNLVLRFWEGWEGSLELLGEDIRRYRAEDVRRVVTVVPQRVHLFTGTIRENLLLADPGATPERLEAAARTARILDFIEGLPEGWDTWIGEQGLTLSGGERQRLALARSLVRRPSWLVLDEPTANLDRDTERELLDALHRLMESGTLLVITHRLVRMELFDEIVVLERGRVAERGRHDALVRRGGPYRRLWDLQNGGPVLVEGR